jgi:hypothetical protein
VNVEVEYAPGSLFRTLAEDCFVGIRTYKPPKDYGKSDRLYICLSIYYSSVTSVVERTRLPFYLGAGAWYLLSLDETIAFALCPTIL